MTLGDRMKGYESAARTTLTKRMPMIIRCDGKAFHTFTRGLEKPWCDEIINAMSAAATGLMNNIQGAKLAYVQSDEISVLVTDYDSLKFEPWFAKSVQKVASVSASIATMEFNKDFAKHMPHMPDKATAVFDARCFTLPKDEVNNYFIWRQKDAVRNSIQALGQYYFSHKVLQGKNTSQIQEMLFSEHGINWNDLATHKKRGWCIKRKEKVVDNTTRKYLVGDWNIPTFTEDRTFINNKVFFEPKD